jgi:succinate-acetate transporter protein
VLFAIFVLIDFLFVGLALSTLGIMHHAMHNLAAYSELFISLLAFASAASVLNTHFGQVVLPVGEPFGIFKKVKQDNPDDTFL